MIRTGLIVLGLLAAIVWLPFWVQAVLFVVGTIIAPYRLALFVPAVFADALYAPGTGSLMVAHYTIGVAVLLVVHWILIKKTRVGELYAMEKK